MDDYPSFSGDKNARVIDEVRKQIAIANAQQLLQVTIRKVGVGRGRLWCGLNVECVVSPVGSITGH